MRGRYVALTTLALAGGIAAGVALERKRMGGEGAAGSGGPAILYWVAPMDPNFRKDGPGKSPMGMDLVPVYEGDEPSGDPSEVVLSPVEINAIGVRTAVARIEEVAQRVETVGFVGYDEHVTSHIHMRVDGWIERLKVRAIGDAVDQGDLLFELYAPEITIGSSELMRAVRRRDQVEERVARRKLKNFGVTERQIEEMAGADAPAQNIRVYAPRDGVVIGLEAADGMYLQPNVRAMSLTDLSSVWLIVDVFERDIARLSEDMTAIAEFEHLPGHRFEGEIDYIYPELDVETRTLSVRLRFDNHDRLLRPNMFGNVTLVPSERREALTVPSEALIRTGRAERVILKTADGTFKPRLVTTGLRDNFGESGRTEIVQGLAPGEEVVASAQFLIDSESALSAGLMRMAPTEGDPAKGTGTLIAVDAERRQVSIRHEPIESLDWPAMETRFTVGADVALERVAPGDAVEFAAVRGADRVLTLTDLGSDDGIDATGTGLVHAVTPDGKLTLSHDPIPELGWPAMQMDMPVAGLSPGDVPLDTPITFDLAKGDDGLFTIVGVRAGDAPGDVVAAETTAAAEITASGLIESVDPETRMATINHGPMAEIGMPGMTMDFAIAENLDAAALPLGTDLELVFARPDGLTMVLAEARPAGPEIMAEGTVNSVDAGARTANVTHGPLTAIGMPGMTMEFGLAPGLDPESVQTGPATIGLGYDAEGALILESVEPAEPPMRVMGKINEIDLAARTANITHGPLAEIGMPGMTMDFPLGAGVEPDLLPVGQDIALFLEKGADFSLTLVGVEAAQ